MQWLHPRWLPSVKRFLSSFDLQQEQHRGRLFPSLCCEAVRRQTTNRAKQSHLSFCRRAGSSPRLDPMAVHLSLCLQWKKDGPYRLNNTYFINSNHLKIKISDPDGLWFFPQISTSEIDISRTLILSTQRVFIYIYILPCIEQLVLKALSLACFTEGLMFTLMFLIDLNWISYTGMYTGHTVFNHCVQNIWYFVCFKNGVPYIKLYPKLINGEQVCWTRYAFHSQRLSNEI